MFWNKWILFDKIFQKKIRSLLIEARIIYISATLILYRLLGLFERFSQFITLSPLPSDVTLRLWTIFSQFLPQDVFADGFEHQIHIRSIEGWSLDIFHFSWLCIHLCIHFWNLPFRNVITFISHQYFNYVSIAISKYTCSLPFNLRQPIINVLKALFRGEVKNNQNSMGSPSWTKQILVVVCGNSSETLLTSSIPLYYFCLLLFAFCTSHYPRWHVWFSVVKKDLQTKLQWYYRMIWWTCPSSIEWGCTICPLPSHLSAIIWEIPPLLSYFK